MKKIILIGLGDIAGDAVSNLGIENIEYVYDNYFQGDVWENIPVIGFSELKKKAGDYRLIITPERQDARFELCRQFQELGLEYELYQVNYNIPKTTAHIYGKYPQMKYEFNCTGYTPNDWVYKRALRLRNMFQAVFNKYHETFLGQNIDIWHSLEDLPILAYQVAIEKGLKYICCYATTHAFEDVVIPMPDYNSYISEHDDYPSLTFDECRAAAEHGYIDKRAFWVGALFTNKLRTELYWMGKKHPEYLCIYERNYRITSARKDGGNQLIPLMDFPKYKYLIDVPGFSWADRTKMLLQLGRPVLMVDRFEKEWYWDDLVSGEHYIPVRSDFSDLISNIVYLDEHPEIYKKIVDNAKLFSEKHFKADKILQYMRDAILKYGTDII